ncbi:Concanavalin A-like lectin/glucanases superfamily protein [Caldithrix abyssi DSM 13497]|nr:Concanavalin A-like lectin/glucanases superfamily protein [Caldithrix abyssi DSM 13497]
MDMRQAPREVSAIEGILANEQDTLRFQFTIADSYAVAEVNGIPTGSWTLTVNALDADGTVIYSGSTTVYIAPGIITPVYLQLNPVSGSLRIIVTWGDTHPDLIAYFPFDGHLNDQSAFQNNALDHGGVTFVPGKFGQAVNFDGIDDYLEIPHLDIYNLDEKTIAFWFYKNNDYIRETPGWMDNEGLIFKSFDTSLKRDFSFLIQSQTPPFNFKFNVYDNSDSLTFLTVYESILPKTWYHIVGVISKYTVRLYLNGKLVKDANFSGKLYHNEAPIILGVVPPPGSYPSRFFNGKIDDFVILGYALSSQEVIDIYQNGFQN